MKVTGETFSFTKEEKEPKRKNVINIKLAGKRTVTRQNSGELYTKKHRRGNS
jgi:hypothetical protein